MKPEVELMEWIPQKNLQITILKIFLKNGLKHTLKLYGYKHPIRRVSLTSVDSTSKDPYLCEKLGLSIEYFWFYANWSVLPPEPSCPPFPQLVLEVQN